MSNAAEEASIAAANSRKIIRLQQLKKEGNSYFGRQEYSRALEQYEQALNAIDVKIPLQTSDESVANYMSDILRNNQLLQRNPQLKVEISKVFANRSECYIRLDLYSEAIHNASLSLHFNALNEKSLYRRGKSHEALHQYQFALRDYTRLIHTNPTNAAGVEGARRVRSIIEQKGDRTVLYINAITELLAESRSANPASAKSDSNMREIIGHITVVMNQIQHTSQYHHDIVTLGFTHALYEFALSPTHHINIRIESLRALQSCVSQLTNKESYSTDNQSLVYKAFKGDLANSKDNFIDHILIFSDAMLAQLVSAQSQSQFKGNSDSAASDNSSSGKLQSITEETTSDLHDSSAVKSQLSNLKIPEILMPHIIRYLLELSSNQYLMPEYNDKILKHFTQYFTQLYIPPTDVVTRGENFATRALYLQRKKQRQHSRLREEKSSESKTDIVLADDINSKAEFDMTDLRQTFDTSTGDKRFVNNIAVVSTLLRSLSHIAISYSGDNWKVLQNARYHYLQHLLFSNFADNLRLRMLMIRTLVCLSGLKSAFDEINDKKLNEMKKNYDANIKEFVRRPLVSALKKKFISPKNKMLRKALRGLALVLQSNFKLGCEIAGTEEVLNLIVEVASLLPAAVDAEQEKKEHDPDSSTSENVFSAQDLIYLGCEVLALSSSHGPIRKSIMESGNAHLFVWVLGSKNLFVRAHAASALSKFAAVDEDARELALGGPNRCLYRVMEIIWTLCEEEKEKKAKYTNQNSYQQWTTKLAEPVRTEEDRLEEEEFVSYKVPLMNLCMETLSYLSLHIETKWALVHKKQEMMRILISLSDTIYFQSNRALRHGLLTTILNCSLSKSDAWAGMSQKEKLLKKLKRQVASGLPSKPTQEDDIIHSRAGEETEIADIQLHLVECNVVKLMYDVVRWTTKENKRIDAFLNDQFDIEADTNDATVINKPKPMDTTRPKPKKFSAEEINKIKKKNQFKPVELDTAVQLQIALVLLAFATRKSANAEQSTTQLAMIRGKLIQQNAVRLLLDLYASNVNQLKDDNEKVRLMSSTAVARIGISINPSLFNPQHIKPMITAMLYLIKEGTHQLNIYEALLTLCNLSSLSDDIREYIIDRRGFDILRDTFEDDHTQINAAILECWCNLCVCDAGIDKLTRCADIDIKIVTLFLRHDSLRIQIAVANILTMASGTVDNNDNDNYLCRLMARNGAVVLLHVLLNVRQSSLIDRSVSEADKHRSVVIIERIRMCLDNLEKAGFSMKNLEQHNMDESILNEFKKHALQSSNDS